LLLARILWVTGVLAALAFTGAGIPALSRFYNTPCDSTADSWCLVIERGLSHAGLASANYAAYLTGLMVLAVLPFAALCFLIAWQKWNSPRSLFFSLALLFIIVANVDFNLLEAIAADHPAYNLPARLIIALGNISLILFYLFPDGRFVPRWTRGLSVAVVVINLIAYFPSADGGAALEAIPWLYTSLAFIVNNLIPLTAIYAIGHRYRRDATPEQRQQIKWIMLAVGIGALLIVPENFIQIGIALLYPLEQAPAFYLVYTAVISPLLQHLIILLIAASFYFSIIRYRLWDVDFIINRSLVYGALSLFLAAVFGIVVYVFYTILPSQYTTLGVGVAAVVAGLLFQPARTRLQHFVDQRLYHIQINYSAAPRADQSDPRLRLQAATDSAQQAAIIKNTRLNAYTDRILIAQGGMGAVYKATHPTLQTPVAIKVIRPDLAHDAAVIQRFEREGRLTAKLDHPNIPRVYDCGQDTGEWYMVMDWVPGQDLHQRLRSQRRLPLAEAQPILRDVASALDHAHGQGIFHRDIKPANIMLTPTGQSLLMDFGIARQFDSQTQLTQGGLIGTLDYMAPEQIRALPSLDGRADVYALGVLAYQILTGELPFRREHPGMLVMAHLSEPPPDAQQIIPDLPESTALALQKAMAKEPEERFATAGEFVRALFG
jgi:hypothetical protein